MHDAIIDIETSDLTGDRLWLVMTKDLTTGTVHEFTYPDFTGLSDYCKTVRRWIGHNIIGFDLPVLHRHFSEIPKTIEVYDTLVVSRLLKFNIEGGHSLDAWGKRLGILKGEFNDFSTLTPEMIKYCLQDLQVTQRLWDFQKRFREDETWQSSIEHEHRVAQICRDTQEHGFCFNFAEAQRLHEEIQGLLETMDKRIEESFQPRVQLITEVYPREKADGTLNLSDFRFVPTRPDGIRDLSEYNGSPFSRIRYVPFNPGSPKQMVERLNEAGWRPVEKTKTHLKEERNRPQNKERLAYFREYGWKVSETNLSTLSKDAPEGAHLLAQRLCLSARLSDLVEWMNEYNTKTQRIHGSIIPIGAWTHRVAHHRPNTGNIAAVPPDLEDPSPVEIIKSKYDGQLRGLWHVPSNCWQVGIDMESAHLRLLAHMMDDPEYIASVCSGDKKLGTDPHTLNMKALGDVCRSRDDSKTFIYTWLNGGGTGKVASILKCSTKEAKAALDRFTGAFPGLKRILEVDNPRDAEKGFFTGIDGRKVIYGETHGMLAGKLQNAEKIILGYAAWHGREACRRLGIPVHLLNLVHDEIQVEVHSNDRTVAEKVGEIFAGMYTEAAEYYKLKCPFAGGVSIGRNWREAH